MKAYAVGPNIGFRDGSVVKVGRQALRDLGRCATSGVESTLTALKYDLGVDHRRRPRRGRAASARRDAQGVAGLSRSARRCKGSTGQEAWVTPTGTRPFFSRNVRDSYLVRDVELAGPADAQVAAARWPTRSASATAPSSASRRATTIYFISDGKRRPFSSSQGVRADGVQDVQHPDGRHRPSSRCTPEGKPL